MRLYGGRKVNRQIDRRFRTHTESRDAIVWDVDQSTGVARCKVQGSDELILCHYPQNWQTLPYYVKPGFAIRIVHKGGQKGFQEIAGPGRAVPSPVAGAVFPPPPPLFDGILTGMTPTAVTGQGGLYISMTNGTFRIDGVTYSFSIGDGGVLMGGDDYIMDPVTGIIMGAGTNALLVFDAAPAPPNARYDLVVVAADGILDVIKGTASANPVMPAIPADHIKVFHVLIIGGMTEIEQPFINTEWEPRALHSMSFLLSGAYALVNTGMYCSLTNANPTVTVTVTLLCQYGWAFSMPYSLSLMKDYGTGTIGVSSGGPWEATGPITKTGTGSSIAFTYRRQESLYDPEPPGGPLEIDITSEGDPSSYIILRATVANYLAVAGIFKFDLLFTTPP